MLVMYQELTGIGTTTVLAIQRASRKDDLVVSRITELGSHGRYSRGRSAVANC